MKKTITTLLITATLLSSSLLVSADFQFVQALPSTSDNKETTYQSQNIGNLKGFSDLSSVEWAREAIEDMSIGTYKGLFSGTTSPDANGLAKFSPNSKMSRAEFLTVVTRALYSDQLAAKPAVSGAYWYTNNYDVALDNGLITETEYKFNELVLNAPIPRQEMALILTRACVQKGEKTPTLVSSSKIADYYKVGEYYKKAVKTAFTKGLIAGKDDRGTFDPHATLTRAEGATVLYRLVNEDKRVNVSTSTGGYSSNQDLSQPITIYQGQERRNRNAKAGDTFVKADGTKIVLQLGPHGILGEGQGVAADVGLVGHGIPITEKGISNFTYKVADYGDWYDSTGDHLQNAQYLINKITGEGYWHKELQKLREAYPRPNRVGYEGEITEDDGLHLYIWEARAGGWTINFYNGY